MSVDEEIISAYVDAALGLHDLKLDAERRAAVIEQFRLLTTLAGQFLDQPLAPDDEPAPVFRL